MIACLWRKLSIRHGHCFHKLNYVIINPSIIIYNDICMAGPFCLCRNIFLPELEDIQRYVFLMQYNLTVVLLQLMLESNFFCHPFIYVGTRTYTEQAVVKPNSDPDDGPMVLCW
jgi:hypothetical protein